MAESLILTIFFIIIVALAFKKIMLFRHTKSLNVFDGLFFGGFVFILIPLSLSFLLGEIKISEFTRTYRFDIRRDLDTTIYCFFSILLFGIFSIIFSSKKIIKFSPLSTFDKRFYLLAFFLYFFSELAFFLLSGKAQGGSHWFSANEGTFERGSLFVLLGQFHNVGRVVVPAVCMYFLLKQPSSRIVRINLVTALIIICTELILSGNRIAMMFVIISFIIPFVIQKRYKLLFTLGLLSLPLISVAQFWPMVRGLLWTEKITTERFTDIVTSSYQRQQKKKNELINNSLLTITEGSNLVFLNYIMNEYPKHKDFLYGETLILKSFGTLVPKSVWKDKPDGLGSRIGASVSDYKGLVLNATIIGEAWANFGYFGIIIILFIIYFVDLFCKNTKYSSQYSIIFFMISIASWRFDFSFFIVSIIVLFLIEVMLRMKILNTIWDRISLKIFK